MICDFCYELGATREFCGNHYHEKCYEAITELLSEEIGKRQNEY